MNFKEYVEENPETALVLVCFMMLIFAVGIAVGIYASFYDLSPQTCMIISGGLW